MKKHLHKKIRNFTPVKTRHPSYALALVRTKTLQFFLGVVVVASLVGIAGFTFVKTRTSVKQNTVQKKVPTSTITPAQQPKYYTVQEGESLWNVASRAYGDPYKYTKILDLNNIADPNNVDPGTRLRVR